MKNNQKGFGVIEIIIVTILVAGVIGLGWYVYDAYQKKSTQNSNPQATQQESKRESDVPAGYKKYTDSQYRLSFIYPEDWVMVDKAEDDAGRGVLVKIASPDQDAAYKAHKASGRPIDGPPASTFEVSRWDSINDPAAKGGESIDEPTYVNLEDYFNSAYHMKIKQKIGERTINSQKAYEVSIGGFGQTYGVMFERGEGIYQVEFLGNWQKTSLTEEENQILESFKFN